MGGHPFPKELTYLLDCTAVLQDDDRCVVRRYWDEVIREEWVAPVQRHVRGDTSEGPRRREARRAMARIAAASRPVPVLSLPMSAAAGSAVAA